jgi:hypothetical protein
MAPFRTRISPPCATTSIRPRYRLNLRPQEIWIEDADQGLAFSTGRGIRVAIHPKISGNPFRQNALSFIKMASSIMPLPAISDQQAYIGRARGRLPAVLLSVVATLAVVAPLAIFFWPDKVDPQVNAQETTSGIEAINDRPAAEKFLAQTRGTKAINNSLAAEDQFIALSARLSTLQDAVTRILRDNAALAEQLRATQTQMAQDNALVAEQLNALMQMMARGNEKPQHRRRRRR